MIRLKNNGEIWTGTEAQRLLNFPNPTQEGRLFREGDTGIVYIVKGQAWVPFITAGGGGGSSFLTLTDTPASYVSQGLKIPQVNVGETALAFTDSPTVTNLNITETTNKNYVTDSDIVNLGNLSGTNTGDQDLSGYVLKTGSITQISSRSHTDLTDIGTNTHIQIDSHISSILNPHSVTFTQVGADPAGTDNSTNVTLAGTLDYLTLLGQQITLTQIDLTTDVTGVLPDANVANNITLDNLTQITTKSHTVLSDIGTNTHAQIDSHITDGTIHFTAASLNLPTTYLAIDGSNANTAIDIQGQALRLGGIANVIQSIIKANVTQTVNLTEWQNSSGTPLSGVEDTGHLFSHGILSDTNLFFGIGVVGAGTIAHTISQEGWYNVGIGQTALYSLTTGSRNVGIGRGSLYSILSGFKNMAIGSDSLRNLTTGFFNVGIGTDSGYALVGGSRNVIIGNAAMYLSSSATYCVAVGTDSLRNTNGTSNVGIGNAALYLNISGEYNVGIGRNAGYNQTTGSSNVYIGYNVRGVAGESNKLYVHNLDTTTPLIYGEFNTPKLEINGTFQTKQARVKSTETSTTTATMSDSVEVHFCNSTTAYTVTLPTQVAGKEIKIINTNTGQVTLSPASGTIMGETTQLINQNDTIILVSNGTNWY